MVKSELTPEHGVYTTGFETFGTREELFWLMGGDLLDLDKKRIVEPLSRINFLDPTSPDNFADGPTGRRALELLKNIEKCEAREDAPCENSPALILNYDYWDAEELALCLDHLKPAMDSIESDLSKVNKPHRFGINGWGRA